MDKDEQDGDGELVAEYLLPSGIWVYIRHGVKWAHPKKGHDYSCWSNGCGLGSFKTLHAAKEFLKGYVAGRMHHYINTHQPIIDSCKDALLKIDKHDWFDRYRVDGTERSKHKGE